MNDHLPSLGGAALLRLHQTILELNDLTLPDDGWFDRLVGSFETLIPYTSLWIACSDVKTRRVSSYLGPWAPQAIELGPAFARNVASHPQFMALCQGIAEPVDAISDYITKRRWKSTGMYEEVVRQAGAIDQLSASLPLNDRLTLSMVLNRDRWGFTAEERSLLFLLMPHIVQSWRTRMLLKGMTARPGGADETAYDFSCHLLCDSLGNVVEATESTSRWVHESFGRGRRCSSSALPLAIREWLVTVLSDRNLPSTRLTQDFTTIRWTLVRVAVSRGSVHGLHTVTFSRPAAEATHHPERLTSLGLSPRQAEVLLWVSHGKTNEEIATILGLSLFTVKAHLRAIFSILMVETRSAAGAIAWQTQRV